MRSTLRIAVIGAGYWGPNLARNFQASPDWELAAICDLDPERARALADRLGGVRVETDLDAVLRDPAIDAVAIATPARTHHAISLAALRAGKHVVVEKPLADSTSAAREMVAIAAERGLVLMADHTYCYTPAVLKMRELIESGELGDILFVDSVRINLGLVQPDVDVLWDLAPHDLSIIDFILPGGLRPASVAAQGADPLGAGKACVGYLTMPLEGGGIAHVHVNWLSPTKIRRMVVGGTKKTVVWDDLNPQQRLSVYDRGVDLGRSEDRIDAGAKAEAMVRYRLGDTWSPSLPETEALSIMADEFAGSIREARAPRTDGLAGLRVLSVLESATISLAAHGARVDVEPLAPASPTRNRVASLAAGPTAASALGVAS